MKSKIIYHIVKALILIACGSLTAFYCQLLNAPIWILFCACLFSGMFLQWWIFDEIEKKNNWELWK